MNKKFLEELSRIASVKLVAKLKDERIGLNYPGEMRIFIPDLHMFSKARQQDFNYECHTNYNEDGSALLPQLTQFLLKFKTDNNDKNVLVYQLGDLLDIWRETAKPWDIDPGDWQGIVQRMIRSNAPTWDALVDDSLHTNFLLGNHDFDLHRIPTFYSRWQFLRYYFSDESGTPVAGLLHGDIFVWYERFPDWIQQFFVYHYSPKDKSKKFIKKLDNAIRDTHKRKGKYVNYEEYDDHKGPFDLGELVPPQDVTEDVWNIKRKGEASKKELEHLGKAKKLFSRVNNRTGYKLHMAVIGHTHHPRIAVDDSDDELFILVDCGGWVKTSKASIEKEGNLEEVEVKNAQIGVLYNNEVCVYQLSPKES